MLLKIGLAIFIFMNLLFLMSIVKKNYALVDIGWGLGFMMVAGISYINYPLFQKNILTLLVVSLWGLRLAIHLFFRNKGKLEDFRYAQLRAEWGKSANLNAYFKVFLLQGILMFIVSLPISAGMMQSSHDMNFTNWIGLMLWIIGWTFEVVADHYLNWFKLKKENIGKICTSGPWRLSRFPNYFGEIILWYGIYLLNVERQSWWTIIGPITINYFILKVSGVPFLEDKYKNRPEYIAYSNKVPRLIPFTKPGKLL